MAGEKKNLKSTKVVETPKVVETKKKTKKVVAEPVVAVAEPVVAVAEPVVAVVDSKKKATKKTTKKTVESVAAATTVVEPVVATVVEPVVAAAAEVIAPLTVVAKPRSKKAAKKTGPRKAVTKKAVTKKAIKKAIKKVNADVEADVDAEAEAEDQKNTKKTGNERYFKILDGENRTGRFKGTKPKQAACKAFTAIVKSLGDKYVLGTTIPFTIVECTRRSSNKEYNYNGRKAELETPHQVEIKKENNETSYITYKYKNYIKKDKVVVA